MRHHVTHCAARGAGADERVAGQRVADALGQRRGIVAAGSRLVDERLKARLVLVGLERDRRAAPGTELRLRRGGGHG